MTILSKLSNAKRGELEAKKWGWEEWYKLDEEQKEFGNVLHLEMMVRQPLPYYILDKAEGCYCETCRLCIKLGYYPELP